jgi:hypothetical protein
VIWTPSENRTLPSADTLDVSFPKAGDILLSRRADSVSGSLIRISAYIFMSDKFPSCI